MIYHFHNRNSSVITTFVRSLINHGTLRFASTCSDTYFIHKHIQRGALQEIKGSYEVGKFPKLTLKKKDKSTYTQNPAWNPIFRDFAASKELAKIEEERTAKKYKVYADGSAMDGGVGAAAVLFENGREKSMIRMHLGTQEAHNTYDAELAGISLALELIRWEKVVEDVMLYGDSQGALSVIRKLCSKGGHGGAREQMILEQLEGPRKRHGNIQVEICWIPGHEGIFGIQRADKEAKRATKQLLIPDKISPPDCGVCSSG